MKRREFIAGLLVAATSRHARAQQPAKVHRIAFVTIAVPIAEITEASSFRNVRADIRVPSGADPADFQSVMSGIADPPQPPFPRLLSGRDRSEELAGPLSWSPYYPQTRIDRCSTSSCRYYRLRYKASAALRMLPTSTRAAMEITLAAGVFWAGPHATVLGPGNHLAKIRGRGWKLLARCRIDRQPPAQPWLWRPGYYPSSSEISRSRIATCLRSSHAARASARANGFRWIGVQPGVVQSTGEITVAKVRQVRLSDSGKFFPGRERCRVTRVAAQDPTIRRAPARGMPPGQRAPSMPPRSVRVVAALGS